MKVGYVRCSTAEHSEGRQMKMMEEQKNEKIYINKASGKNVVPRNFKSMIAFVRVGNAVWRVSPVSAVTRGIFWPTFQV